MSSFLASFAIWKESSSSSFASANTFGHFVAVKPDGKVNYWLYRVDGIQEEAFTGRYLQPVSGKRGFISFKLTKSTENDIPFATVFYPDVEVSPILNKPNMYCMSTDQHNDLLQYSLI